MKSPSKWIQAGYLLSITLFLSSCVYFFASNWPEMERSGKITLSVALMLGLYTLAFVLDRYSKRPFLANAVLLGGCVAFGISTALLGQIYNSHADSYSLFLLWLIPALLYSWLTRLEGFYILSIILAHVAILTYLNGLPLSFDTQEVAWNVAGYVIVVMNMGLFFLIERGILQSKLIKYVSFVIAHFALIMVSNSFAFEHTYWYSNAAFVLMLIGSFLYLKRTHLQRGLLFLTGFLGSLFASAKFIELTVHYHSITFFFFGLVFIALLIYANIKYVKYLNALSPRSDSQQHEPDTSKSVRLLGEVLSAMIMIIGVFIGTVCIIGLVTLFTDLTEFIEIKHTFVLLGTVGLIAMLLISKLHPQARYTILFTSLIVGLAGTIMSEQLVITIPYLALTALTWWRLKNRFFRMFLYLLINIECFAIAYQIVGHRVFDDQKVFLSMALLNAGVFVFTYLRSNQTEHTSIVESSLFFTLTYLFINTFDDSWGRSPYLLLNGMFFIVTTFLVLFFLRLKSNKFFIISLAFWIAFIVYKYYDLAWKLLHKSVSLAVAALLLLLITYFLERRQKGAEAIESEPKRFRKPYLLALVVLLQLGSLSYQIISSETLLANGKLIKLELAPLDPRSMLQGDYVQLRYRIGEVSRNKQEENFRDKRVKVVLSAGANGVYQFNRYYQTDEVLQPNEVMLAGKEHYYEIEYGIENYFIPEGTGRDVEQAAKFAEVRVGTNGNAILVRLLNE